MQIDRMQVEEGFLDGLSLTFSPGLNVIIGSRGTGKTSVIELIRFALGVENFTSEAAQNSSQQVAAILRSGRASLTVSNDDEERVVSRTENEEVQLESRWQPLIFSQKEIESLGKSESGRLRLIDGFLLVNGQDTKSASELQAIRALTKDIASRLAEVDEYAESIERLPALRERLSELNGEIEKLSTNTDELLVDKKALNEAVVRLEKLSVATDELQRLGKSIEGREDLLDSIKLQWGDDPSHSVKGQAVTHAREASSEAFGLIERALSGLSAAKVDLADFYETVRKRELEQQQIARDLRGKINKAAEGAGTLANQAQEVRQRIARIESLQSLSSEKIQTVEALKEKRAEYLEALEDARSSLFEERKQIVDRLNNALGPRLKFNLERGGQSKGYALALVNMLRGSRLRGGELAASIAQNVSPRELAEFAEDFDFRGLSDAIDIPEDRAAKCLTALRENDVVADLIALNVEDSVDFYLLDESEYKSVDHLSMGQRCTVVLPIIFERKEKVLIVDQPEDHIDNAFISDTLIKSISDRSGKGQIILATHNANIPVLGEADRVFQLSSDGKRGFVKASGGLESPEIVKGITSVMEGGKEAFAKRAAFYAKHA